MHSYKITIIFIGFLLSLIILYSQTNNAIEDGIAQPSLSTNITSPSIVNDNLEEQNKSKIIKAFGHFANNQINDGIVTWIQGGYWNLKINNNITTDSTTNVKNKNNSLINDNGNEANFKANFTMIKPDGSHSHNHNIENFISDKVIVTDMDIVVTGKADISSDSNKEYKNVPLIIHLMGNKVLGLTIDIAKTQGHFSGPNEMFGTLISGVGLNTSTENSIQTIMQHNGTATNGIVEKETMTMMQH